MSANEPVAVPVTLAVAMAMASCCVVAILRQWADIGFGGGHVHLGPHLGLRRSSCAAAAFRCCEVDSQLAQRALAVSREWPVWARFAMIVEGESVARVTVTTLHPTVVHI